MALSFYLQFDWHKEQCIKGGVCFTSVQLFTPTQAVLVIFKYKIKKKSIFKKSWRLKIIYFYWLFSLNHDHYHDIFFNSLQSCKQNTCKLFLFHNKGLSKKAMNFSLCLNLVCILKQLTINPFCILQLLMSNWHN